MSHRQRTQESCCSGDTRIADESLEERLKKARIRAGFTGVRQVERALNELPEAERPRDASYTTINRWERGIAPAPAEYLVWLVRHGADPAWLLGAGDSLARVQREKAIAAIWMRRKADELEAEARATSGAAIEPPRAAPDRPPPEDPGEGDTKAAS